MGQVWYSNQWPAGDLWASTSRSRAADGVAFNLPLPLNKSKWKREVLRDADYYFLWDSHGRWLCKGPDHRHSVRARISYLKSLVC